MTEHPSHRGLWRNSISYLGVFLGVVAAIVITGVIIVDTLRGHHSPYLGLFTYMVMPAFLVAGGVLFALGMWREYQRRRKSAVDVLPLFPVLDLNKPMARLRFVAYVAVSVVAILITLFLLYEAYHFTESVAFCGEVCHKVMEPEYVAYQNSPHARVSCAECHVGAGADFYVKSKLSGTRQLFAVTFNTFSRPIATPIENLRPARETCETCHWPNKFYGGKLFSSTRHAYDEANTPRTLSMILLTGGAPVHGKGSGIHWHMILSNTITFKPADRRQQVVSHVRVKRADGSGTEYKLQGFEGMEPTGGEGGLAGGEPGEGREFLLVDCVTCHNRPTHVYRSPESNVDEAMDSGLIDPALPDIKRKAVEALVAEHPSKERAQEEIARFIQDYYARERPEAASAKGPGIARAVEAVQRIYRQNIFPYMRVTWRTYPNNIGHRDFPGCFRCHDGRHVSEDGKVIPRSCVACHTMPTLGPMTSWTSGLPTGPGREPWHPFELKGKHFTSNCEACHDGGLPRASTCAGCHQHPADAPMADMECSDCHLAEQSTEKMMDCSDCHDEIKGLHREAEHEDAGCDACHSPHTWIQSGRGPCESCHDDRKDHHPGKECRVCHPFR